MSAKNFFNNVYSVFVGISLFGGFVVFLFMMAGLITGGEGGAEIMLIGRQTIMPRLIQAAGIAVISGMIFLYVTDSHDLTLKKKNDSEETPE